MGGKQGFSSNPLHKHKKHAAFGKALLVPLGNHYDSNSWNAGFAEQGRKKLFITSYVS